MEPVIGVLALQGDYFAHSRLLGRLGVKPVEVRRVSQLSTCGGLILPGGESTTLLNLMADEPWFEELGRFHARGGALLATCAGAILVAREVLGVRQPSLGLIDIAIRRNAYGRQVDSFETSLVVADHEGPMPAVFIRAPIIERTGPSVEVLARCRNDAGSSGGTPHPGPGDPVLVRDGAVFAATFHPELSGDDWLHRKFLEGVGR